MTTEAVEKLGVKLKDCPFCGSEAKFQMQRSPYHDYYWAKCSNKDCAVSTMSTRDPVDAAKLWNQRATQ